MLQKLRSRIESPANTSIPRAMFGILTAVLALECAFELWSWRRGNGSLITALGLAGMSLMMLFFFSRQPRVRWVAYILGAALILLRIGAYIRDAFVS